MAILGFRLLNKHVPLVVKFQKRRSSSLRLWPLTNHANFCFKILKTKTTLVCPTGTAVTPGGSYTEKGEALASLGPQLEIELKPPQKVD